MFRRTWLLAVLAGCYHAAPSLPSEGAPTPATAPDPSAPRLRRLSVREVCNAYADLLGESIAPSEFLTEPAVMGFDNGSSLSMMQTDQAARFEAVAWAAAERVTTRREPKVFAACATDCKRALVDDLARRAYRRPLTADEHANLGALYDAAAAEGGAIAERTIIAAIFQSPAFLYREELGAITPSGVTRLTPYEIASELSFFIAGTTPDDVLLAAAASGELDDAAARQREATRLLQTPAARKLWRTFLRQWLALEDLPSTTKAPPYAALSPALLRAMDDELDRVFDHVLWESTGSLDELFATNVAYPGSALAPLYGVMDVVDSARAVALDDATRGGVLTRAGWLSVHSAPDNSAPIARGVFVLSSLLCRPPPAPPSGIPRVAAATEATKTTRQRFARHTQDPGCQTCHQSIDGVGFGFEEFDAVGTFRRNEGETNVDSSGSVELDGANVSFVGVTDLSKRMRASAAFRQCFVKQMFRFAMGAPETAAVMPVLIDTSKSWSIDHRIDALAIALVGSDAFVVRNPGPMK